MTLKLGRYDSRGNKIAKQVHNSQHGVQKEPIATRIVADCSSFPAITIAGDTLLMTTKPKKPALSSDHHVPIIISLQTTVTRYNTERTTNRNFIRVDWTSFTEQTEQKFANVDETTNLPQRRNDFKRFILKKAAKINIPRGRIPTGRCNVLTETARLADRRDSLRTSRSIDLRNR